VVGNNNKAIKILGFLMYPMLFLVGCSIGEPSNPFTGSSDWLPSPPQTTECSTALEVLNWTAGISIIGGMLAMVITRGRIWRPIAIGIALIILSYVIAVYSQLVLLPIGISVTIVCIALAIKVVMKVWRTKI
jgi:hypothetical protein